MTLFVQIKTENQKFHDPEKKIFNIFIVVRITIGRAFLFDIPLNSLDDSF